MFALSITREANVSRRSFANDSAHFYRLQCALPVTERRVVAFGDLLHLVVVSQHKERLLEFAHLLHFGHHIFIDSIHDLLRERHSVNVVCLTECLTVV